MGLKFLHDKGEKQSESARLGATTEGGFKRDWQVENSGTKTTLANRVF